MKNVNAASKPVDCPRCNKSIDVEVLHTGIIHDVKLTSQVIQKVESDEHGYETPLTVKDSEGAVIARGLYKSRGFGPFTYGHNTPDIIRRGDKARYLDEPDEQGRDCVRIERCCEVDLETVCKKPFTVVNDSSTRIYTKSGFINCKVQGMVGDD